MAGPLTESDVLNLVWVMRPPTKDVYRFVFTTPMDADGQVRTMIYDVSSSMMADLKAWLMEMEVR